MSRESESANIAHWRKGMRAELIARREAAPEEKRRDWSLAITLMLLHALPVGKGTVVGFCWPHRSEFDARPLLGRLREIGARCALPETRCEDGTLVFRHWEPGVPMRAGPLGIPYPAGSEQVVPDVLLIPLVGFGRAGDRLGYGGGYFDRTLAVCAPRPLCVGVGFELSRIETSFPQPHDIPMDAIVTEAGMRKVEGGLLEEVSAARLREYLVRIAQHRTRARR